MFKYPTPCKILLFTHMAAWKEELAMQKNTSVYCLMSYQDVTKHVAKFQKVTCTLEPFLTVSLHICFQVYFFRTPALSVVFNIYHWEDADVWIQSENGTRRSVRMLKLSWRNCQKNESLRNLKWRSCHDAAPSWSGCQDVIYNYQTEIGEHLQSLHR